MCDPSGLPALVRSLVTRHEADRGPLLPILHDLQREAGHIPAAAVPLLARELNLSRADVHGVVTFYRDFTQSPSAGARVRVCRGEACQAVGADALAAYARTRLGAGAEDIFCLGNCALGPCVAAGGRTHGLVSPDRLDAIADEVAASPAAR